MQGGLDFLVFVFWPQLALEIYGPPVPILLMSNKIHCQAYDVILESNKVNTHKHKPLLTEIFHFPTQNIRTGCLSK